MALITGGLGGLGLIASRELCVAGDARKVVAVSRSGRAASGPLEEQILETLQEYLVHEVIRCDLSDSAGVSDAFRFADGGQGPPEPRRGPAPPAAGAAAPRVGEVDLLGTLQSVTRWLGLLQEEGAELAPALCRRIRSFRDGVAATVAAAAREQRGRDASPAFHARLRAYREELAEVSEALRCLGSGSVDVGPGERGAEGSARRPGAASGGSASSRASPFGVRQDFGMGPRASPAPAGTAAGGSSSSRASPFGVRQDFGLGPGSAPAPAETVEPPRRPQPRFAWQRRRPGEDGLVARMQAEMSQACGGGSSSSRCDADADGLRVGARVDIFGMSKARELNGCTGVLTRFDVASGRWEVLIDGVGHKRLKPENVRSTAPERACGGAGAARGGAGAACAGRGVAGDAASQRRCAPAWAERRCSRGGAREAEAAGLDAEAACEGDDAAVALAIAERYAPDPGGVVASERPAHRPRGARCRADGTSATSSASSGVPARSGVPAVAAGAGAAAPRASAVDAFATSRRARLDGAGAEAASFASSSVAAGAGAAAPLDASATSRAQRSEERRARLEAERRALEAPLCPAGHALTRFDAEPGFPCDACGAGAPEGGLTAMWGCRFRDASGSRACDYDVCGPCKDASAKKRLRQEARRREREEYERLNRQYQAQKADAAAVEADHVPSAGGASAASARAGRASGSDG